MQQIIDRTAIPNEVMATETPGYGRRHIFLVEPGVYAVVALAHGVDEARLHAFRKATSCADKVTDQIMVKVVGKAAGGNEPVSEPVIAAADDVAEKPKKSRKPSFGRKK